MTDLVLIAPTAEFLENQFILPNVTLELLRSWIVRHNNKFSIEVLYMAEVGNDYTKIPEAKSFGISFTTPLLPEVANISRYIKTQYPAAKIIGGGAHPSALPYDTLQRGIVDIVIPGAGEIPLLSYLAGISSDYLLTKDNCSSLMDKNPYVYRANAPDIASYSDIALFIAPERYKQYQSWLILDEYGCAYNCNFCYKMHRGIYRFPQQFVEYQLYKVARYMPKSTRIKFASDNSLVGYTQHHARYFELCADLKIPFETVGRLDNLTTDKAQHLKDCGCEILKVGLETGSPRLLEAMGKKQDFSQIARGFEILDTVGLPYGVYLIADYPGETEEDLEQTINFVQSLNTSYIGVSSYTPYPGSPDWYNRFSETERTEMMQSFGEFHHLGKRETERSAHKRLLWEKLGI